MVSSAGGTPSRLGGTMVSSAGGTPSRHSSNAKLLNASWSNSAGLDTTAQEEIMFDHAISGNFTSVHDQDGGKTDFAGNNNVLNVVSDIPRLKFSPRPHVGDQIKEAMGAMCREAGVTHVLLSEAALDPMALEKSLRAFRCVAVAWNHVAVAWNHVAVAWNHVAVAWNHVAVAWNHVAVA
jgi:hypothetical protein